jgi:hypothetical protein
MILAIDPGNIESAYCYIDENYKPIQFGKVDNEELLKIIAENKHNELAIEMVASYGMAVGKTVFDTCVWSGRYIQKHLENHNEYNEIYRKEEKINLCQSMKAKDGNIRQALIDRFGVVGTKKNQGWFYGFSGDIWSAYAVGITYKDKLPFE